MEFLKKFRDDLMGVEYENEEEDYDYVEDYEDDRGYGSSELAYSTRFDRDEREEERPSKSKKKKKKDGGIFGFVKEPSRNKRKSNDHDDYDAPRYNHSSSRRSGYSSKIVDLPTAGKYNSGSNYAPRVALFYPETLEDARPVCENLKDDVICVIVLERLDKAVAQRIADFLGGACDALNGGIQRISHDIFLIAPENVAITSQVREELKNNGVILPWVQTAFRK